MLNVRHSVWHRRTIAAKGYSAAVCVLFTLACATAPPVAADLLPPMNGSASDFALRRAGAVVNADVRVATTQPGLHSLGRDDIVRAGVPAERIVGNRVRMFYRENEIAVYISDDGLLDANDFILFYAESYESTYTRTNVYWLGFGEGGLRMASRDGRMIGAAPAVTQHLHTVVYRPEKMYVINYRTSDASIDHWFAAFLSKSGGDHDTFELATEGRIDAGTATLSVVLHGVSSDTGEDPDHRTSVRVGGTTVGSFLYDGQSQFAGELPFSSTHLQDGQTSLAFVQTQSGVSRDTAFLERCTLRYPRHLGAIANRLTFAGPAGSNNYTVAGLTTGGVSWVADVSDPAAPVLLTGHGTAPATNGTYEIRFGDASPATTSYHVAGGNGLHRAQTVQRVFFRNLAETSRQADYILVCPYAFRKSAYRLLKHRRLEGHTVAVAPLEDVFNEFSYGIADAGAIKQFLGYAFHHWRMPVPRYVLLAGEGTYDPKGNLGNTEHNVIPVHLGPSSWRWTSLENWFVMVNGLDQLADMAIGRIPVTHDADLGDVVDKILAHEASLTTNDTWQTRATVVADDAGGGLDFLADTEAAIVPHLDGAGFTTTKVYLDQSPYNGSPSYARSAIRSGFNSGRLLFTFLGHGAADYWTAEQVWRNVDAEGLANTVYPILAMFTCQTGYAHDPGQECIAEVHLENPSGGAVGCFGPTILGNEDYSTYVADGFVSKIADTGPVRLGDAMLAGVSNLFVNGNPFREELSAYQVFGDPATLVRSGD
jgi:hypothetical protein